MQKAKPTSSREVNAAIRKAGMSKIELVKGAGYFYFVGHNADDHMGSVFVPRIGDLSTEEWVLEASQRYIGNQ